VRLGRRVNEFDGSDQRERIFVLVIAFGERKIGLIVNELEGEEELVIKSLDHQTVATDLVSGASILGDGRVVMIMNVAAILERFAKSRSTKGDGAGLLLSAVERQAQARFTPEATS
jgi:two-component system chemotaxis sensor kinase CheA